MKMIVVNSRFLTQQLTGVQRYAIELSLRLKSIYKDKIVFFSPPSLYTEFCNAGYSETVECFTYRRTFRILMGTMGFTKLLRCKRDISFTHKFNKFGSHIL